MYPPTTRKRYPACLLLTLGIWACNEGNVIISNDCDWGFGPVDQHIEPPLDIVGRPDFKSDLADGARTEAGPTDQVSADARPQDGPGETADQGQVSPGEFGAPCATNTDCASGWCLEQPQGYVCTQSCDAGEGCPQGWGCVKVLNTAPDYQYVCYPVDAVICHPCLSDRQCGAGFCLTPPVGNKYCSRPCEEALPCPDGYTCQSMTSEEDPALTGTQCVPQSGTCDCGPAQSGQTRTCYNQNEWGWCWGLETCDTSAGWVGCDARLPDSETCDGEDNDCDNAIDEDLTVPPQNCVIANDEGACAGSWFCRGVQGWRCEGPQPEAEICDYRDNDCNGATDETFRDSATGAYNQASHCGICGYSCADSIPFVREAECVLIDDQPTCHVLACETGYELVEDLEICLLPSGATDCSPCAQDSHCSDLPGSCRDLDGSRHCLRPCDGSQPCPDGYACQEDFCTPTSGSCTCQAAELGQERPCYHANSFGVCTGVQQCQGEAGWNECSAPLAQTEVCDGADNDCDSTTDEPGTDGCQIFYRDDDEDQFGRTLDFQCLCQPDGSYRADVGGDCDDQNPQAHPEAVEVCNGLDDNCVDGADEADAQGCQVFFRDADGDGAGVAGDTRCLCTASFPYTADGPGDCNDQASGIAPTAAERCDGIDNNCDGQTDEPDASDCTAYFTDGDGDDYGSDASRLCLCAADLQHPVAVGGDCDDNDATIHPDQPETCNGRDDNCDEQTDEEDAIGCTPFALDEDGDGYGVPYSYRCLCSALQPYDAPLGGDCDDADPGWIPGSNEACSLDADCCLQTHACRYGLCVPQPTACNDNNDCNADTYCDGDECIPYGLGPGGHFSTACGRPPVPGLFQPTLQCAWSGPPAGDPFPGHVNNMSTAMVADFNFDNDPSTVHPSIVFTSYNYTDGGAYACDGAGSAPGTYFGVIRVIDGADCQQQYNVPAATGGTPLVGANPPALVDLDLDGRPEIVAHAMGGGLVAFKFNPTQHRFDFLWESHTAAGAPHRPYVNTCRWSGPSVTELDGDNLPELLMATYVYNSQGVLQASNLSLSEHNYGVGNLPVVADVDRDGVGEMIMGNGVFHYTTDAAGAHSWQREAYNHDSVRGLIALGDFGNYPVTGLPTGIPEIVVVSSGQARVMDLSGTTIFGPYDLPYFPPATDKGTGGPPTVGDFDNDGRPEFALAGRGSYTIFDLDCMGNPLPSGCWAQGILWSLPSRDYSSSVTGSSIFDFEGDGFAEGVYSDECFTRIYRGVDGEVLFSQWRSSCTWYENPIIADVDGDRFSEIVMGSNTNCSIASGCSPIDPYFRGLRCQSAAECISGQCVAGFCRCATDAQCGGTDFVCTSPIPNTPGAGQVCRARHPQTPYGGVRVYRDSLDNWVNSRTIWNQHAYFVTHIRDDASVPPGGEWANNWGTPGLNNFRQNVQGTLGPTPAPDLTIRPTVLGNCDAQGALPLRVNVCNRGSVAATGTITVAFYDGDPSLAHFICLPTTTDTPQPGTCVAVGCTWTVMPPGVPHEVYVTADHGEVFRECWEGNNIALLPEVSCTNLP